MGTIEGVIKYHVEFVEGRPVDFRELRGLNLCRKIFFEFGLIGQYPPNRFGGAGYGAVAQRMSNGTYVTTASQTGMKRRLGPEEYVTVVGYDPRANCVRALRSQNIDETDAPKPSSESMTLLRLLDLNQTSRFALHAHSPEIWNAADRLHIPTTDARARYGTPEMVGEIGRLFEETDVAKRHILIMGGHEEGVITFGSTPVDASSYMLAYLAMCSPTTFKTRAQDITKRLKLRSLKPKNMSIGEGMELLGTVASWTPGTLYALLLNTPRVVGDALTARMERD